MSRTIDLRSRQVVLLGLLTSQLAAQAADQVSRLGSTDSRTRYRAYQQLRTDKTRTTLALLAKALPDYPYQSQTLGLSLVQSFGADRCESVMRGFLRGKPSFLRLGAAVWFYQRGDHRVESHIVASLRGAESPVVMSGMLSRIWNVKSPAVLAVVQDLLTAEAPVHVLGPALRMLLLARAANAIPRVESLLRTAGFDAERRALCAGFLLVMGQSGHAETLAEAIPELQNFSRLSSQLQSAGHLEKTVLAAVLEYAKDRRGYNVRYALQLLAKHDYRAAVPDLRRMLESADVETSKAAFDALMRMGDGLQPRHLKRLLAGTTDSVSLAAADALRRTDDASGLPRVIELTKTTGRVRYQAYQVLGKFRDRRVVPILLAALQDADQGVRSAAFLGLQTVFRYLFPYRRFDFSKAGYNASAAPLKRREIAEKIRLWWQSQATKK